MCILRDILLSRVSQQNTGRQYGAIKHKMKFNLKCLARMGGGRGKDS